MKVCRFWDECQPEVMRNCCRNDGIWRDNRQKNRGKQCGFYLKYEKEKLLEKRQGAKQQ